MKRKSIIAASCAAALAVAAWFILFRGNSRDYAPVPTANMQITGTGAGPVKLGMTRDELIAALGSPDSEDGGTLKYFGMGSEVFVTRGAVSVIHLHSQTPDADRRGFNNFESFQGQTEKGIGVNALREEVVSKYGQPKSTVRAGAEEMLVYENPKFTFAIDGNGRVRAMMIRK
jgi:hypothetical protein